MAAFNLERLLPEYIRRFEAYIPSKPDEELKKLYGCSKLYRLNNNENPLGPPTAAVEVLRSFDPKRAAQYPSGDSYYLRKRLGEYFGLDPEMFLVGNGANEVIGFVVKAFCGHGDNIVTADRTFAVYEWTAEFSGVEPRLAPLKDFAFDPEAMLSLIDERTKVIFVCNPNNPTGRYWNRGTLLDFLRAVDNRAVVVLDEAYNEFVEQEDYPQGAALLNDFPNLVVFRTFSKMYGLAALRVGYLIGNARVVDAARRACVVYSVNFLAQEAARAALGDEAHIQRSRRLVKEAKAFLLRELRPLGLQVVHGEGNFMMIGLPMSDTLAYRRLMAEGVMVRSMTGFRFPNFIRLTMAREEAMEAFMAALKKILS
jgi:histidinol-phosphate aminotransferase